MWLRRSASFELGSLMTLAKRSAPWGIGNWPGGIVPGFGPGLANVINNPAAGIEVNRQASIPFNDNTEINGQTAAGFGSSGLLNQITDPNNNVNADHAISQTTPVLINSNGVLTILTARLTLQPGIVPPGGTPWQSIMNRVGGQAVFNNAVTSAVQDAINNNYRHASYDIVQVGNAGPFSMRVVLAQLTFEAGVGLPL